MCAGTFGQEKQWSLGVPNSYQHPLNSQDLLLHTEAMPLTPPPHDKSDEEKESSKQKQGGIKLSSVARAVQATLKLTEVEEVHLKIILTC